MSQMIAACADDAAFDAFIAGNWDKNPAIMHQAFDRPVCSPAEMLGMVRSVSDAMRDGKPLGTRFFVDGLEVPTDHPLERAFLASPADQSLTQYIDGVSERLGARPFYLMIDNAALLNLEVWERMRNLAARVTRQVGYPTGRIEYNVFLGTETFTPSGIHIDNAHTLTVQAGDTSKTMLTWPPDALKALRPGIVTKDPACIEALSLTASTWRLNETTDVLYVPAGWWHTTCRPAACHYQASLALGFVLETSAARTVAELVARELRTALDAPAAEPGQADDGGEPTSPGAPSTRQCAALDQARQLLSSGSVMAAVEDALRLRTLRRQSGLVESNRIRNLEPVFPAPRAHGLPDSVRHVRLCSPLLRDIVGGRLVIAANGFTFVTATLTENLSRTLRLLETGEPVSVECLCDGDAEIRRFLQFGWITRALADAGGADDMSIEPAA